MEIREASALVTGAGRGIGRSIALALAREGARVTVVSRTAPELSSLVGEIEAVGGRGVAFAGDLRSPSACAGAVAAAVECFGGLQILVNNAGWASSPTWPTRATRTGTPSSARTSPRPSGSPERPFPTWPFAGATC